MGVLEQREPRRVFHYFEEICGIPHGSKNNTRMSEYCIRFAQEHGLAWRQDELENVIIRKPASPGYEDHPTVIIQGHMDMVCEKEPDNPIDFENDGLTLIVDGDWLHADGTTLGADDGVALAVAMAILEDDTLLHPPLEVIFTTDEETGMYGAKALDTSDLNGRILLNLDSEEEGVFTVGCAGGARPKLRLPISFAPVDDPCYTVTVSGLIGGHSGAEIDKGRLNSNVVMGQFLKTLPEGIRIVSIAGGTKDNAIPRQTVCTLCCAQDPTIAAAAFIFTHHTPTDPGLSVAVGPAPAPAKAITAEDSARIVEFLCTVKNGVQKFNKELNVVQTSLNLGILEMEETNVMASFAVRSSVNEEKEALLADLDAFITGLGGRMTVHGQYPAWEYRPQSPLQDKMAALYTDLFGTTPVVEVTHGGLECGLLSEKLPGLDAVSFGPAMADIHTSRERLNIPSMDRFYRFVCRLLEEL